MPSTQCGEVYRGDCCTASTMKDEGSVQINIGAKPHCWRPEAELLTALGVTTRPAQKPAKVCMPAAVLNCAAGLRLPRCHTQDISTC
jgi:hypothetical protein